MLESLLSDYGYPTLFISTLREGESIMVPGGLAAHPGYLSLDRFFYSAGGLERRCWPGIPPGRRARKASLTNWGSAGICSSGDSGSFMAFAP